MIDATIPKPADYFVILLSQVPESLEDEISQKCFALGASGVSENLNFTQPDLTYEPILVHRRFKELSVFFEKAPPADFEREIKEIAASIVVSIKTEAHKDWLEVWKKDFKPFALAGDYWVVPSWLESPVKPEFSLSIDPGMAFGTGTHATTQMAAAFLARHGKQNSARIKNETIVDVGAGTGILSILSQKLGWSSVLAVEIDPEARRVCRDNVKLNHSEKVTGQISVTDLDLEEVHQRFEVVVANIIDGVLVRIGASLMRVLADQGTLFVTGILLEREEYFMKDFIERHHLFVARRWEKDEWVGYSLQRNQDVL
jgi:ribosomal protein L11 methyltransferase